MYENALSLNIGLLLGRLVIGLVMAAHGAQKLFGWFGGYGLNKTGEFFVHLGFQRGRAFAAAASLTEITSGLLLALGLLAGQPWFYQGLGMETATLPIALALFLLVVPEFTFFVQPLLSLFSRKNEYEADRYAAANADAAELVRALVKLYHDNSATLTPDPLHSAYYDSHPPAAMRIARLRTT